MVMLYGPTVFPKSNSSVLLSWTSDKLYKQPIVNVILFFTLIFIGVPSILINIFAIYRLHGNTKSSVFTFRTILHISLFTSCTCVPFFLLELLYESDLPLSPFTCKLWLIIDYSSIVCLGLMVCWASIQRHILIFGPMHLKKLQSKFKFKMMPTILAMGLPLTWYSIVSATCVYNYKATDTFKCRPCFENNKAIFLADTILSLIVPLSVNILVTSFLLIRILRLRYSLIHTATKKWRRCKRLTRQTILFSAIYLAGLLPYVVTNLNSLYKFWPWMNQQWCVQISDAFTYVPCCFSSFLTIYAFPEIWTHRRNPNVYQNQKLNQKNQMRCVNSTIISSQC